MLTTLLVCCALAPSVSLQQPVPREAAATRTQTSREQFLRLTDEAKERLLKILAGADRDTSDDEQGDPDGKERADGEAAGRRAADQERFAEDGALPASTPGASRKFQRDVRSAVATWRAALVEQIATLRGVNTDAARSQLADLEEELHTLDESWGRYDWNDLRIEFARKVPERAGWSWRGSALVAPGDETTILPLSCRPRREAFELEFVVVRRRGEAPLALALPFGNDKSDAVLVFGGWKDKPTGVHLFVDKQHDVEHVHAAHRDLFQDEEPVTVRVAVSGKTLTASVAGEEVYRCTPSVVPGRPRSFEPRLPNQVIDPTFIAGKGSEFEIRDLRYRAVPPAPRTEAVLAAPRLLPANSKWQGRWNSKDSRKGPCDSIEVIERADDTAVVKVHARNGSAWTFTLSLRGTEWRCVDVFQLAGHKRDVHSERPKLCKVSENHIEIVFHCKHHNKTMHGTIVADRK